MNCVRGITAFSNGLYHAAVNCQAQLPAGQYQCLFAQPTKTNQVQLVLLTDRTCYLGGLGPVQYGTWDEKRLVRTFSILNSTNQFVGTIRARVVRGRYVHYITDVTGALDSIQ